LYEAEDQANYWVISFKLRPIKLDDGTIVLHDGMTLDDYPDDLEKMVWCMYYALTTLSTVGYGDFYPTSIAEKVAGSII